MMMFDDTRKEYAHKMAISTRRVRAWDELSEELQAIATQLFYDLPLNSDRYVYGLTINMDGIYCRRSID